MSILKGIGITLAALVVSFGLIFVATGADYTMFKFWAPKYEAVKRDVFVNTPSFAQGKIISIGQYRLAYETADTTAQKKAMRQMILTEANQIDNKLLPEDMQIFINSLK